MRVSLFVAPLFRSYVIVAIAIVIIGMRGWGTTRWIWNVILFEIEVLKIICNYLSLFLFLFFSNYKPNNKKQMRKKKKKRKLMLPHHITAKLTFLAKSPQNKKKEKEQA